MTYVFDEKRKKENYNNDDIEHLKNINVHSHEGCIIFLNADVENPTDAGKIKSVSKKFLTMFKAKTKEDIVG